MKNLMKELRKLENKLGSKNELSKKVLNVVENYNQTAKVKEIKPHLEALAKQYHHDGLKNIAENFNPNANVSELRSQIEKLFKQANKDHADKEVISQVVKGFEGIMKHVKDLWRLYEKHDELNDIQPDLVTNVIPMSLDDWYHQLLATVEKWEAIQHKKIGSRQTFYKNDPFWMTSKYGGHCRKCQDTIKKGDQIWYYPKDKKAYCEKCGKVEEKDFLSHVEDEEFYNRQYNGKELAYKLRAECLPDVHKLMAKLKFSEYKVLAVKIEGVSVPDVELEFKSDHSLNEIKSALKKIPDSHVMLETVALKKDYTGKRL